MLVFTFDTFGILELEAGDLLHRVQRIMHSNVMFPRSTNIVFTRIDFTIQIGLAVQLVGHLSTIHV